MPRWFRWLAFVLGLAGLTILIVGVDPDALAAAMIDGTSGFAWMCLLHVAAIAFDGLSICACLAANERGRLIRACIYAQLVGHSINNLTPGRALGELIKLDVLKAAGSESAAAAVTVGALTRGITNTLLYGSIAVGVASFGAVPAEVSQILGVGGGLTIAAGLFVLVLASTRMPADSMSRLIRVLPARWRAGVDERWQRLRRSCHEVTVGQRLRSSLCALAASAVEIAEIYVVLSALGVNSTVVVLAAASSGQIVRWVTAAVPMSIGTAEGGGYALFRLLGASTAAGVALELLIKMRVLVFSVLAAILAIAVRTTRRS